MSRNNYKERDILRKLDEFLLENSLLKSQKLILEKELAIVKDNAQELNKKYTTDILYYAEQQQKNKRIIENLENTNKQILKQLDVM